MEPTYIMRCIKPELPNDIINLILSFNKCCAGNCNKNGIIHLYNLDKHEQDILESEGFNIQIDFFCYDCINDIYTLIDDIIEEMNSYCDNELDTATESKENDYLDDYMEDNWNGWDFHASEDI